MSRGVAFVAILRPPSHEVAVLPALDVRHVARSHRAGVIGCCASVRVLVDVTLRVRAGEIVGVCGAGGAGKSTLLLCAAGLLQPDRGEVRWFGAPAAWSARRERGVALVAADPPTHAFLTARQSLEYVIARDRSPLEVREAAEVRAALDRVGLARAGCRRLGALSPAARTRLALARALLERPRLLLLDVPLDATDARSHAATSLLLREIAAEGAACLVAARESGALRGIADRILTLVDGHAAGGAVDARPAERCRARRVAEAAPVAGRRSVDSPPWAP